MGSLKRETLDQLHDKYKKGQWFFSSESKESATVINELYGVPPEDKTPTNGKNRTALAVSYLFKRDNYGKGFHDVLVDHVRTDVLKMDAPKPK